MTEISTSTRTVITNEGSMDVFVAEPVTEDRRPALVVLQEVFGVNDHIRDVTQRFAREGYVALAPDLFHRFETRVVPYGELDRARELLAQLTEERIVTDVNGALDIAYTCSVDPGRVAAIGFCFGGRAAFVAAVHIPEIAATVSYYGRGIATPGDPDAPINRADRLSGPTLAIYGGLDTHIEREEVDGARAVLEKGPGGSGVAVYEGAGHAFFNDARPDCYHERSANEAWRLTLDFLERALAVPGSVS